MKMSGGVTVAEAPTTGLGKLITEIGSSFPRISETTNGITNALRSSTTT
jgi:hypothetical protein